MYDFHDDTRDHHGSQCKQYPAFKRQNPSLAWALSLSLTLGTFRHISDLEELWELSGIGR